MKRMTITQVEKKQTPIKNRGVIFMKLKKIMVSKIPFVYESNYRYKFQTKLLLFWWTLRIGRIQRVTVKSRINLMRDWKFWLVIIPNFKEGVIDG